MPIKNIFSENSRLFIFDAEMFKACIATMKWEVTCNFAMVHRMTIQYQSNLFLCYTVTVS